MNGPLIMTEQQHTCAPMQHLATHAAGSAPGWQKSRPAAPFAVNPLGHADPLPPLLSTHWLQVTAGLQQTWAQLLICAVRSRGQVEERSCVNVLPAEHAADGSEGDLESAHAVQSCVCVRGNMLDTL